MEQTLLTGSGEIKREIIVHFSGVSTRLSCRQWSWGCTKICVHWRTPLSCQIHFDLSSHTVCFFVLVPQLLAFALFNHWILYLGTLKFLMKKKKRDLSFDHHSFLDLLEAFCLGAFAAESSNIEYGLFVAKGMIRGKHCDFK